jgi:hypothetical protein
MFDVISKRLNGNFFETFSFLKKDLIHDSFAIKDKIKNFKLKKEEAELILNELKSNNFWSCFVLNEEEDIVLFVENYITLREII